MKKNSAILAVCEAGEDRSVAFAFELKHNRGYTNVVNCGVAKTTPDTFATLAKWADHIYVVADPTVWRRVPHIFRAKATFVDIGPDIWRSPENPKLKQIIRKECDKLGL